MIERQLLPSAPAAFGNAVQLPDPALKKAIRRFALENRAAAILANRRLHGDKKFYEHVLREFGRK